MKKGAFTAPTWSGHRGKGVGCDFEAEISQGVHFAPWRGINTGNMAERDHQKRQSFRLGRLAQESFQIVAEGTDWIVVNKPAGLLTHPTRPDGAPTLFDGLRDLLAYELVNGGQLSIITRLDRETSGLVLLGLTRPRARSLGLAMQRGEIGKEYLAIVRGWPEWDELTIDAPLLRQGEVVESAVWLQRCVHPQGVKAVTMVSVKQRYRRLGKRFTLIQARPKTGRTHQIRVHLAHAGYPLVGDKIYGGRPAAYLDFIEKGWTEHLAEELLLPRHALHACGIIFPTGGEPCRVDCGLTEDLEEFLAGACGSVDFS